MASKSRALRRALVCSGSGPAGSNAEPLVTTVCDGLSLAKAFYFAMQAKADVINLSLSGPDSRLLRALLDAALSRGSIVVTAYDSAKPGGGFPASVPGVIAVSDRSFTGSAARFTRRRAVTFPPPSPEDAGFWSTAAPFRQRM